MTKAQYIRAYTLAHGHEPTSLEADNMLHEEATLRWASEHPNFKNTKNRDLAKIYQKHQRDEKAQEAKKTLDDLDASCLHLGGTSTVGSDVDQILRKKHGLHVGDQVWTSPVTGEKVRGTRSKAFLERVKELAMRTGWIKEPSEMEWE